VTPLENIIPDGHCHCGCGRETPRINRNRATRGLKKGDSLRFIRGHQFVIRETVSAEEFQVEGVYCRWIALTQGQRATVWASDFDRISKRKWYAAWSPITRSFYAVRHEKIAEKWITIPMHREILGLEPGDPREGDHVDSGQTLDNRRSNIRIATSQQNGMNSRIQKNSSTGFKGVSYRKDSKMYRARIMVDGKSISLGGDKQATKAHELYAAAAKRLHGEFARP
jgi:hypothetical protein